MATHHMLHAFADATCGKLKGFCGGIGWHIRLSSLCVLYISKNVGNNIKREENMKKKLLPKYPHPLIFFYFIHIYFVKYKTHTGYRTHELTCVVSSCVLCPLCVLYVLPKNVGNNIKREETYSREACTCDEVMSF